MKSCLQKNPKPMKTVIILALILIFSCYFENEYSTSPVDATVTLQLDDINDRVRYTYSLLKKRKKLRIRFITFRTAIGTFGYLREAMLTSLNRWVGFKEI